jgi:hypothetical protein
VKEQLSGEYNNIDLPSQDVENKDVLGEINKSYFLSMSSILKIQNGPSISLVVEEANEEQQRNAYNFLTKSTNSNENREIVRNKWGESIGKKPVYKIGFTVKNAKGKSVQSISSSDVKIIECTTNLQDKYKESFAFKDKKTLKKELEDFFNDEDEEEKF